MPLSWIFWDHNLFWNDENYRREIARSYPTAIGGDVVNFSFNATDGEMFLAYVPNSPSAETILFLSVVHRYLQGYDVSVSPSGCCVVDDVVDDVGVGKGNVSVRVLDVWWSSHKGKIVTVIVKESVTKSIYD